MPRPGMVATARQWLVDFGIIQPDTPQQRLRAERTVPLAPASEQAPELSPDGDNQPTSNDAAPVESVHAPAVEHQVPVTDTPPDAASIALVPTAIPEPVAVLETHAEPATTQPNRFIAWLRDVFGVGASSPNDPLRLVAALSVAAVTGVISYDTLLQLGLDIGFDTTGAHLFPIGIDAAVFLFTRAWMNRRLPEATRQSAKRTALFFMAMSVLGNAIEHGKHTYDAWTGAKIAALAAHRTWQPGTMDIAWLGVTIVYSALMPLALGKSLHLISQVADTNRKIRDEKAEAAVAPAVPEAVKQPRRAKKKPKSVEVPQSPDTTLPDETATTEQAADEAPPETIDFSPPTERPDWLTDDMSAKDAMKRYLDLKPNTNGAVLGRWAANYFDVGHDYGRKIKAEWLAERSKAVAQ